MRRQPSRYSVSLIALLIFLLTGQTGVQGYVWCLGEDGHTELEYAEYVTCGSAEAERMQDCHAGDGLTENHVDEDHCGPCLDIPTFLEAASRRNLDDLAFKTPLPVPRFVGITTPAVVQQAFVGNLRAQPPPRISETIRAHRTVVLLN